MPTYSSINYLSAKVCIEIDFLWFKQLASYGNIIFFYKHVPQLPYNNSPYSYKTYTNILGPRVFHLHIPNIISIQVGMYIMLVCLLICEHIFNKVRYLPISALKK